MSHMDEVRARLEDPETDTQAYARVREVKRRLKGLYANELALALQREAVPKKKFVWLRKLGDALGKAMDGVAPCRDGCSHCCNMATLISTVEAQTIAKATGAKLADPGAGILSRVDVEVERAQYNGVPCTFLKAGRCSIYEHRPWGCRVHYVMDKDNLLCKIIPGVQIESPMFNSEAFNALFILAHPDPENIKMADIREFFPEGA